MASEMSCAANSWSPCEVLILSMPVCNRCQDHWDGLSFIEFVSMFGTTCNTKVGSLKPWGGALHAKEGTRNQHVLLCHVPEHSRIHELQRLEQLRTKSTHITRYLNFKDSPPVLVECRGEP